MSSCAEAFDSGNAVKCLWGCGWNLDLLGLISCAFAACLLMFYSWSSWKNRYVLSLRQLKAPNAICRIAHLLLPNLKFQIWFTYCVPGLHSAIVIRLVKLVQPEVICTEELLIAAISIKLRFKSFSRRLTMLIRSIICQSVLLRHGSASPMFVLLASYVNHHFAQVLWRSSGSSWGHG